MSENKRDCVFLVADKTMKEVFKAFLTREEFHQSLGCAPFEFDPEEDLVAESTDNAVFHRADLLLRQYELSHRRAVVALDAEWDGSPGVEAIVAGIQEKLRTRGWEHYAVIVIEPELEAWIWQDNPHVHTALRYCGKKGLREWLKETGEWPEGSPKPLNPKAAMRKVLGHTRTPWSASIHKRVASRVSVRGCLDPAFQRLAETFRMWFPENRE